MLNYLRKLLLYVIWKALVLMLYLWRIMKSKILVHGASHWQTLKNCYFKGIGIKKALMSLWRNEFFQGWHKSINCLIIIQHALKIWKQYESNLIIKRLCEIIAINQFLKVFNAKVLDGNQQSLFSSETGNRTPQIKLRSFDSALYGDIVHSIRNPLYLCNCRCIHNYF